VKIVAVITISPVVSAGCTGPFTGGERPAETDRPETPTGSPTTTAVTTKTSAETPTQKRGGAPDRRKETITALQSAGIVGSDLADRLRAAVGYGDVLAHSYGPIVDDVVHSAPRTDPDRHVESVEVVDEYLQAVIGAEERPSGDPDRSRSGVVGR
jgi:hypothetical protein